MNRQRTFSARFNVAPRHVFAALLALASQRAEFLALEWIDTDWTKSILEEMTRKERGSIPGPIEAFIIMYIISKSTKVERRYREKKNTSYNVV